jgi:nucleotide-binding universal stress UspA family protein
MPEGSRFWFMIKYVSRTFCVWAKVAIPYSKNFSTLAKNYLNLSTMKEIVVAIDFSKGSLHALQYAIHFANMAKCNIKMVWVDNQSGQEIAFSPESGELRDEMTNNFQELVDSVGSQLTGGKLSFKLRKGKVYHELATQAKLSKADLIIGGTHGVTGFEEYWIGSSAFRIVLYAPCPVLTVRYNYDVTRPIRNIIIPIDHTAEAIQKVPYTAKMAKMFNAQVHILALQSSRIKSLQTKIETSALRIETYFAKEGVNFNTEYRFAEDLTGATIKYASETDADMIIIMTEQESCEANLLLGQFTQQMVNFSPIPVICVHPQESFVLE